MKEIGEVRTHLGGVDIIITQALRAKVRKAARATSVIIGYSSGIAALTCAVVAVAQSALVWPVLICGGVAASVAWRCRR